MPQLAHHLDDDFGDLVRRDDLAVALLGEKVNDTIGQFAGEEGVVCLESGVSIGRNTAVWDNVHIRHSTRIGDECIVGGKTYIAYGVNIELPRTIDDSSRTVACTGVPLS